MTETTFISVTARRLIFEREHNFKSFFALYNKNPRQATYKIKSLMQDEAFAKEFGKKAGELTYKQKLMLYEEFGETKVKE